MLLQLQQQQQQQQQWQWQTESQLQTYESFSQLLYDVPEGPIYLSIIVAAVPFLLYLLWKKSILRRFILKPLVTFFYKISYKWKNNKIESRVNEEIEGLVGKKVELRDLLKYGFFISNFAIVFLVLKKAFYFSLVVSQSMAPVLFASELVLVESFSTENVEVGDIIVFNPPGQDTIPVVHRIISIDGGGNIKTKGDNAGMDDWTLTLENIEGKVVTYGDGKAVKMPVFGQYLMPQGKNYMRGSNVAYETAKSIIQWIHQNGPVILIVLFLIILLSSFESKNKYKAMYE